MARIRIAFVFFLIASCACSAVHRVCASEVAWTMVVLPDTQNYTAANNTLHIFDAQTQWIVDNKVSRKIQLVAGQGDITNNNLTVEWEGAANAYSTLNGELPYILVTGNHDYRPDGDPNSIMLNDFFSLSDNPLNSIITERIAGDLANTYSTFEAPDGRKMLLFALEWNTPTEVYNWASTVASQPQFADHTAVLLTHAYLVEGQPDPNGNDTTFRSPLEGVPAWDGFVVQHGNLEMVLSAHYLDRTDSNPYGPLTTGRQSSVGDEGNTVHEIVFNAQEQPNGGNGYLRLMEFLDNGSTVQVRTYSPTLDVWLTDDRNEFQFELTPLYSADFDEDNDVDGSDFLIWQRGFGTPTGATKSQGDADHNGIVDGTDLAVWEANYNTVNSQLASDFDFNGKVDGFDFLLWQRNPSVGSLADWETSYGMVAPLAAASAAVPEPSMMMLGALASIGMMFRQRCLSR